MINSKVIVGLVIGCVLLTAVIGAEWLFVNSLKTSIEAEDNHRINQNEVISLPKLTRNTLSIDHYQHIIETPLFIQGRKPVIEEEIEKEESVHQVKKINDIVLVGIYSIKGQLTALLQPKKLKEKSLARVQGESISDWLIKEVQLDRLILEQAGKQQIMLLRDSKSKPKRRSPIASKPRAINQVKKPKSKAKVATNPFTQMLQKQQGN